MKANSCQKSVTNRDLAVNNNIMDAAFYAALGRVHGLKKCVACY